MGQFWVALELVQLVLLLIAFIWWLIIITDPVRQDITVNLGPPTPGKAGMRDVALDQLSYDQGPLSLAPSRSQLRDYFVVQAIVVGLSLFRVLKYLGASSMFGGLVETFLLVKFQLLQFIIIVSTCNIGFAIMGVILFGDGLSQFHTFDQAYFALLGLALGGGVTYADMAKVNAVGAPVLYFPFVTFHCFITLHFVVALIIESYQVHQAHRARLVGVAHQFLFGMARNYSFFRRYVGSENQWRFEGPDTERIRGLLRTWDFDSAEGEEEYTELELFERLREENVTHDEIAFIFKRFDSLLLSLLLLLIIIITVITH